jgi:hypothetical protein
MSRVDGADEHGPAAPSIFERHRFATLLGIVLVSVLALDFTAGRLLLPRSADAFREPHPYYHHGLIPDREAVAKWGDGEAHPVFTNSLGLLDEAPREVSLASEKHRIVFLGDSYTEGIGVPFPQTFVGRLAREVDRDRVEILNAAVLSYCPKLYHLKTRYLVEQMGLEFDELYVFIDISDIQDEVLYGDFRPRPPTRLAALAAAGRRFLLRTSFVYGTLEPLLRQRRIAERRSRYQARLYPPWLDYFWLDDIDEQAYADPDFVKIRDGWTLSAELYGSRWVRQGLASALGAMDALARYCDERGIRLTIAVYPWTTQVRARDRDSVQVKIWREFSERVGADFIDLFPALITELPYPEFESRYILPGDAHWNAAGHALVAAEVGRHLRASLRSAGVLPAD